MSSAAAKRMNAPARMISYGAMLALGLATNAPGCAPESSAEEVIEGSTEALSLNAVTRESADNQGRQGNGNSFSPSISPNQRYVVFASEANIWAGNDSNGLSDVYLKDRQTGSITLVSAAGGVVGNGESFNPSVASNGTVVFESTATNLAPGATNPSNKILARTINGVISRVDSVASGQANGSSSRPQISGDGNFVVFESAASNLVASDTNATTDVFVRALASSEVTRVSLTQASGEPNGASFLGSISHDGRVVAFSSDATNIVFNDANGSATDVFARDRQTGITTPISFSTTGMGGALGNSLSTAPRISGNGQWVSFLSASTNWDASDTNGLFDVYVRKVGGIGAPTRVSVSTSGVQANAESTASAISYNGDAVAFVSRASNLVSGDSNGFADAFVRDRNASQTIRVSQAGASQANGSVGSSGFRFSGSPDVPGYSFLVFDSSASNLTSGDTNAVSDVFSASVSP